MVALRGRDIDLYLAKPDAGRPIILLYGADAGLVRERADALIASAVDDPKDPFALVRMDGDALAAQPSLLVEEAMTVPLFGGRRAIRIRAGSKSFASGIARAADLLCGGELVAFGTETVYGLGADATNAAAVAAVFTAKGRPHFNPLICHYPSAEAAFAQVQANDAARRLAAAFWPGPLTLVLPRQ
eukprot:gene45155-61174_t